MKKLLFAAVGFAFLGLAACNSSAEKAEKNEEDIAAKIENCTNTDSLQVYVDQAKDYVQKLIDEGKVEEAKEYLAKIQPVVEQKAPQLSSVFTAVKEAVGQVPDAVSNAADSLKTAASAAGDSVKAKASETVSAAKEAASAKATEVVNNAADKAKEKAGEAADKAKEKLDGLFNK